MRIYQLFILLLVSLLAAKSAKCQEPSKTQQGADIITEFHRLSESIDRSVVCNTCYEQNYAAIVAEQQLYEPSVIQKLAPILQAMRLAEHHADTVKERLAMIAGQEENSNQGTLTMMK